MTAVLAVVGHVTRDIDRGKVRLGGAAAYAALAAAELSVPTLVLTAAPPTFSLLEPLSAPGLCLLVQESPEVTTFELDQTGPRRRLWVRAQARPLTAQTLALARAALAYVGPVVHEVGLGSLGVLPVQRLVLGIQGWLREMGPDGEVLMQTSVPPFPDAADLVFSEEDHPEPDKLAQQLASSSRTVIVTRAARGVSAWFAGRSISLGAPTASVVDSTGAGDVFGVVYALRRHYGDAPTLAIERAQLAAARSVEGFGIGRLAAVRDQVMPGRSG